ncbi:LL-diaminopimelate aminotransferase [Hibiscus syriacus]|uniref:LL-diaminopimelate aminotransferase n=1 Tax=Hibiscus syriacus TaxID=106335 RepID=A0A6A3AUQ7_HIBSY|nr:LL-diaminopimelate aminotransferase [Hibiscus syriacus]
MSLMNNLSTSMISSSSSAFLAPTSFNSSRTQNVSVPLQSLRIVKCITTPQEQQTAYKTKVSCNANIAKLQAGYLFPEAARRRAAHLLKYPNAQVISLGIGDTTEPIPDVITSAMAKRSHALSTLEGYSGYGAEQGEKALRVALASTFYGNLGIEEEDIFVSDGAKCDTARLQTRHLFMFALVMSGLGGWVSYKTSFCLSKFCYSVQAYVDSSVIMGQTGHFQKDVERFTNIEYMRCTPENGFFPDLSNVARTDIIFFCSPNNPTGAAATREQLTRLVQFEKDNGSIIVYDSAYACICQMKTHVLSLKFLEQKRLQLKQLPLTSTVLFALALMARLIFSQAGGLACLSPEGLEAMQEVIGFYKENTKIIVETFNSIGFEVYGGQNAPYVWVHFPGRNSWDVFSEILEKTHIVTTPGSGFGPGGEGFIRVSAFGHRENVLEACRRFKQLYN